jgi:hypothetical protein
MSCAAGKFSGMLHWLLNPAAGEKYKDKGTGERCDLLLHAGRIAGPNE